MTDQIAGREITGGENAQDVSLQDLKIAGLKNVTFITVGVA